MSLALLGALTWATVAALATPSPTPSPASRFGVVISDYHLSNADSGITDIADFLLSYGKDTGTLRYDIVAGTYALPVVGQTLYPTSAADSNAQLYGYIPVAFVAYAPTDRLVISAGKQAALLGQENAFTYQNVNVERGLAWSAEPSFSRGVRIGYSAGSIALALEFNDGYYSGSYRAIEGLAGVALNASAAVQVAFIVPHRDSPPNPTASIANKAEYDLMFEQRVGKLQLTPYALYIESPASAALGYRRTESALAASLIADYTVNGYFSLGGRYEYFANHSGIADASANADLVGYGPGSWATSLTLTPEYKFGAYFVRAEVSRARVGSGAQTRYGIELGTQI